MGPANYAIWGKHCLFEEALRSPLIISVPGMQRPGVKTYAVVESLDLFPTLCELTGIDQPAFAQGMSLVPQLERPEAEGHAVYGYTGRASTVRNARYRLILYRDGHVELYDHHSLARETRNIADNNPDSVEVLKELLREKQAKQ